MALYGDSHNRKETMAGITLPSLQKETGNKAQHSHKAKHPHPANFAELFTAKSQAPTEARKNNQPARTAPAEGQKQEPGKRKAAVEPLVLTTPFLVTPQTPSPQVFRGGRSDAVAAAVKSDAHPKTSSHVLDLHKPRHVSDQILAERNQAGVKFDIGLGLRERAGVRAGETSSMQLPNEPTRSQSSNKAAATNHVVAPHAAVQHTQAPQLGIQIVPAQAAGPTIQVAGLIIRATNDGAPRAELILHPESLGTVQVTLQVDPTGALQAIVVADQAASQALSAEIDQLRQSLEAAGLQIADLQMQTRDSSQSGDQSFSNSSSGGTRADIQITNDGSGEPITTQPLHALIQGGASLDLQI